MFSKDSSSPYAGPKTNIHISIVFLCISSRKLEIKNYKTLLPRIASKEENKGWAQWLTPIIPTVWEGEEGKLLELRNSRPAWAT